jgi:ribosomal protein S18 acetylase RimI-like enzyme
VYTAKDFRRRGVYRALYAHVLALAKADPDVRGIRLYVERENVNAMRTYEGLGMLDAGYAMFEASFADYGGKR